MKLEFIPLDYDTFSLAGKSYMKIFGKTSHGKSCCLIDESINFFYVLSDDPYKLAERARRIAGVQRVEVVSKSYMEKEVRALRIFCEHNKMDDISHEIKTIDPSVETRERDINQVTRYIIERGLKPLVWHEVEGEEIAEDESTKFLGVANALDVSLLLKVEKIHELPQDKQHQFVPRVLAFDIESDEFELGRGKILMISLVADGFQKVITWKQIPHSERYVEHVADEEEMIRRFISYVQDLRPDIITGYFTDGFDFPYLRARAEKNGIDLRLGMANSRILFSKGRPMNASIKGLVHVDLLKFIETVYAQYMQSETLRLDDVAREFLGEGKFEHEHKKSHELAEEEWHKFFEYNLQDSMLTYKLFHKLWPDIQEFTRVVQEPLFTATRQSMSGLVESYIIHNLHRFDEIAERRPIDEEIGKRRMREKYEGAFVLQPQAALYEDLAIFDFTSYWPSIIVSFNLSRPTFLGHNKPTGSTGQEFVEAEIGKGEKTEYVYFSKKQGFISKLLGELIEFRKKYKEELKHKPDAIKKARSNAFKLLANAFYGYQGFFGARYYCPEASAATTSISRDFIKMIIEKTNKEGFEVIYSDTDSLALLMNKKSRQRALEFLKKLNGDLPGIMELELEDFFKRGIWVTKRTGEFGAKKKYALINWDGKMKIRGFETVRRDWCALARKVQSKVLQQVLDEGKHEVALNYVQGIIKDIQKRKISKKELIIKTQLKKPISEYESEGPHVAIARKMQEQGLPVNVGMLIEYYVAEPKAGDKKSKARIRDRAKLPEEAGEYDIDYYIDHQILPAVENIFEVFGLTKNEILGKVDQQKKLEHFFG